MGQVEQKKFEPNASQPEPSRSIKGKRYLLIDDDVVFCKIMARGAYKMGNQLNYIHDPGQISQIKDMERYDVIMVDYHLGPIKGSKVASFINRFFKDIPIVMVSAKSDWWLKTHMPTQGRIKHFIHKERSPQEILEIAATASSEEGIDYKGLSDYEDFSPLVDESSFSFRALKHLLAAAGNLILANASIFSSRSHGRNS